MKTLLKWTLEDYHNLIETGILNNLHVEFIEGDIVEMAPEGPIHVYTNVQVADYLRTKLKGLAIIREGHPITLKNSEPEPDIAIVKLPNKKYINRHPFPDDVFWLIEISQSTLSYDLSVKKTIYAETKIQEYWVIDVKSKQVYLFLNPVGNDYQFQTVIQGGNVTPQAFSDVKISVDNFWLD